MGLGRMIWGANVFPHCGSQGVAFISLVHRSWTFKSGNLSSLKSVDNLHITFLFPRKVIVLLFSWLHNKLSLENPQDIYIVRQIVLSAWIIHRKDNNSKFPSKNTYSELGLVEELECLDKIASRQHLVQGLWRGNSRRAGRLKMKMCC